MLGTFHAGLLKATLQGCKFYYPHFLVRKQKPREASNSSKVAQLPSDSLETPKSLPLTMRGGRVIIFLPTCFLPPFSSLPACDHISGEFASLLGLRGPIRRLPQGSRLRQSLPPGGLPELKF